MARSPFQGGKKASKKAAPGRGPSSFSGTRATSKGRAAYGMRDAGAGMASRGAKRGPQAFKSARDLMRREGAMRAGKGGSSGSPVKG